MRECRCGTLSARRPRWIGSGAQERVDGRAAPRGERRLQVVEQRLLGVDGQGAHLAATGGPTLRLEGLDLVDGTPVLDVKPYIPYYDAITQARISRC